MKKLIFVMVAVFSLMFVSCDNTSTSTPTMNSGDSLIEEVDSTKVEVTEVPVTAEVEKPNKPEAKEDVDVTTPTKPAEEANKPVEGKK